MQFSGWNHHQNNTTLVVVDDSKQQELLALLDSSSSSPPSLLLSSNSNSVTNYNHRDNSTTCCRSSNSIKKAKNNETHIAAAVVSNADYQQRRLDYYKEHRNISNVFNYHASTNSNWQNTLRPEPVRFWPFWFSSQKNSSSSSSSSYNIINNRNNHESEIEAKMHLMKPEETYNGQNSREQLNNEGQSNQLMKYFNIRNLGILLFIVASCFCVIKIIDLRDAESDAYVKIDYHYKTELKLVNAFCRHGDRSPSEDLPKGDHHLEKLKFFWPNGMANLTENGVLRQFRLGQALRHRYEHLFNRQDLLDSKLMGAFSSGVRRCEESTRHTLRGFFNLNQNKANALKLVHQLNECSNVNNNINNSTTTKLTSTTTTTTTTGGQRHCLIDGNSGINRGGGSGSPLEWQQVRVDLDTVLTLDWRQFGERCRWRQNEGHSQIDDNLMLSEAVASLPGINELKDILMSRYNQTFVYDAIHGWSAIDVELRLDRTNETLKYMDHFADWILKKVPISRETRLNLMKKFHIKDETKLEKRLPNLLDIYEALNVFVSRDRIPEGLASKLQLGPMLTSLVDSQQVALNSGLVLANQTSIAAAAAAAAARKTNENAILIEPKLSEAYENKKMLIYFTHDTIIQLLMFRLQMIQENDNNNKNFGDKTTSSSYLERFVREAKNSKQQQFLSGLRMSEFGISLVFELYETTQIPISKKSPTSTTTRKEGKKFRYVQAALYNEEEPINGPIEFKYLQLGAVCRRLFRMQNRSNGKKALKDSELDKILSSFYPEDFTTSTSKSFPFNKLLSCPFELFRNVTMHDYAISKAEFNNFCM